MGGIVCRNLGGTDGASGDGEVSAGSSGSFLGSSNQGHQRSFKDFRSNLPVCLSSWDYVVHGTIDGKYLGDWFQVYVLDGLRSLPDADEGRAIEKLLTQSVRKRGKNPVLFVMRYCVRLNKMKETELKRKLGVLGREHARIGVTSRMLNQFVDCLLYGISQCFDPLSREMVMNAWNINLTYIVGHMTVTSFTFVRPNSFSSDQMFGCCTQCGEYLVNAGTDKCEDCVGTGNVTTKHSVDRPDIAVFVSSLPAPDAEPRDNGCFSIKELVKESENGSE